MFTYPVHQAADILSVKANLVPVGQDQLPHVEVTRLIARRFNERYRGRAAPRLPACRTRCCRDAPLLLGTDGGKMSKWRGNAIELRATEDETAALIRGAKTDVDRRITLRPGRAGPRSSIAGAAGRALPATATRYGRRRDRRRRRGRAEGGGHRGGQRAVRGRSGPGGRSSRPILATCGRCWRDGCAQVGAIAEETLSEVRTAMGMRY